MTYIKQWMNLMRFEWDSFKNSSNLKKHGISFEEAVLIFSDKNSLSIYDYDNTMKEDRWITMGMIPVGKVYVVVHTDRSNKNDNIIRIISARKATKNEIKQYIESLR